VHHSLQKLKHLLELNVIRRSSACKLNYSQKDKNKQSLRVARASLCEVPSSIPDASFLTQTQTKILETGMWRYTDNAVCQPKVNKNIYDLENQNMFTRRD